MSKKIIPKNRIFKYTDDTNEIAIHEAEVSTYEAKATSVDGSFSNSITNVSPSYNGMNHITFINNKIQYSIRPSEDKKSYIIQVWIILTSAVMAWNGQSRITVTCNGTLPKEGSGYKVNLKLTKDEHTSTVGPFTFTFPSSAVSSVEINATLDYRRYDGWGTSCIICHEQGIDSNEGPGWQMAHNAGVRSHMTGCSISSGPISVETIPLGNKPANPTLTNNNKYNGNSGISASTNSLTIGVSSSDWGKPDTGKIIWSCSNGVSGELSKTSQFSITGLQPGTTYTVTVYLRNSMGSSNSASIIIRTRHNPPVLTLTIGSVDLEKINLNWTSNKDLADAQYQIDGGSWVKTTPGKSGSFTAKWFEPNTTHTIAFWGRATTTYDSLDAYAESKQGTTLDRAHITSIGECVFGLAIKINIDSESTKPLRLEIWTEGNDLSPKFIFDDISKGTFTFNPTQDQLDKMYKCYPKSNEIPIKFLLVTKGEWKEWLDTQQNKTLELTGIAKTGHVGVNNSARRSQIWWGDQDNTPRRCVAWIGDDSGAARRTI